MLQGLIYNHYLSELAFIPDTLVKKLIKKIPWVAFKIYRKGKKYLRQIPLNILAMSAKINYQMTPLSTLTF